MTDGGETKEQLRAQLDECRARLAELEAELGRAGAGVSVAETILVVEDEADVRDMIQKTLERHGFRALTASGAEEALAVIQGAEQPIHLVLTDVMMPDMSGADLARRLKSERPEIKIMFMSGFTEGLLVPDDVYDVMESGANLIEKPFTGDELIRRIRQMTGGTAD